MTGPFVLTVLALALLGNVYVGLWGMRDHRQAYRYVAALNFIAAGACVVGIVDALALLSGAAHG